MLVTSKLTSIYSWLSAVVTLFYVYGHTYYVGPALNAKLRWPYGCPAHSLRCQSYHSLAEENASQLSGGGIFQQRTPNTAESHEYRPRRFDQVTSLLTSGIAKLVLGSFDRNIFWHQNRHVNDHKYFFFFIFSESPRHNCIPWCALFWKVKSNQIKYDFNSGWQTAT